MSINPNPGLQSLHNRTSLERTNHSPPINPSDRKDSPTLSISPHYSEMHFIQECAKKDFFKNEQLEINHFVKSLPVGPLSKAQVIKFCLGLCQPVHQTISKETKQHFSKLWRDPEFREKSYSLAGKQRLLELEAEAKKNNDSTFLNSLKSESYREKVAKIAGDEEIRNYDEFLQTNFLESDGDSKLTEPIYLYEIFFDFMLKFPQKTGESLFTLFGRKAVEISAELLLNSLSEWNLDVNTLSKDHIAYLKKKANDDDYRCGLLKGDHDNILSKSVEFINPVASKFCPDNPKFLNFFQALLKYESYKCIPIYQGNHSCLSMQLGPKIDLTLGNYLGPAELSSLHILTYPCDDLITFIFKQFHALLHGPKAISLNTLQERLQHEKLPSIKPKTNYFSVQQAFIDLACKTYRHIRTLDLPSMLRIVHLDANGFNCVDEKPAEFYPQELIDRDASPNLFLLHCQKGNPIESFVTIFQTLVLLKKINKKNDLQIAQIWKDLSNPSNFQPFFLKKIVGIVRKNSQLINDDKIENEQDTFVKASKYFFYQLEKELSSGPHCLLHVLYKSLLAGEKFSDIEQALQIGAELQLFFVPNDSFTPVKYNSLDDSLHITGPYKISIHRQNLFPVELSKAQISIIEALLPSSYEISSSAAKQLKGSHEAEKEVLSLQYLEDKDFTTKVIGYRFLLQCQFAQPHQATLLNLYKNISFIFEKCSENKNGLRSILKCLVSIDSSTDIAKTFLERLKEEWSSTELHIQWIKHLSSSHDSAYQELVIKLWTAYISTLGSEDSKLIRQTEGPSLVDNLRKNNPRAALKIFYNLQSDHLLGLEKEIRLFRSLVKGSIKNWTPSDVLLIAKSIKALTQDIQQNSSFKLTQPLPEIESLLTDFAIKQDPFWTDILHDALNIGLLPATIESQALWIKILRNKSLDKNVTSNEIIHLCEVGDRTGLWIIRKDDQLPQDFQDFCKDVLLDKQTHLAILRNEILKRLLKPIAPQIKSKDNNSTNKNQKKSILLFFAHLLKTHLSIAWDIYETLVSSKLLEKIDQLDIFIGILENLRTSQNVTPDKVLKIYHIFEAFLDNFSLKINRNEHSLIWFIKTLKSQEQCQKARKLLMRCSQINLISINSPVKELWVDSLNESLIQRMINSKDDEFTDILNKGSQMSIWRFSHTEHSVQKKFFAICTEILIDSQSESFKKSILEKIKLSFDKANEKSLLPYIKMVLKENLMRTCVLLKTLQGLKAWGADDEFICVLTFLEALSNSSEDSVIHLSNENLDSVYAVTLQMLQRKPKAIPSEGFNWLMRKLIQNKRYKQVQNLLKDKTIVNNQSAAIFLINCLLEALENPQTDIQDVIRIWRIGSDSWSSFSEHPQGAHCLTVFAKLLCHAKAKHDAEKILLEVANVGINIPENNSSKSNFVNLIQEYINLVMNQKKFGYASELLGICLSFYDTISLEKTLPLLLKRLIESNNTSCLSSIFQDIHKKNQTLWKLVSVELMDQVIELNHAVVFSDAFASYEKDDKAKCRLLVTSLSTLLPKLNTLPKDSVKKLVIEINRLYNRQKNEMKRSFFSESSCLKYAYAISQINHLFEINEHLKEAAEYILPHVSRCNNPQASYDFAIFFYGLTKKDPHLCRKHFVSFANAIVESLSAEKIDLMTIDACMINMEVLTLTSIGKEDLFSHFESLAKFISCFTLHLIQQNNSNKFYEIIANWIRLARREFVIKYVSHDTILRWILYYLDNQLSGTCAYTLLVENLPTKFHTDELYARSISLAILENPKKPPALAHRPNEAADVLCRHKDLLKRFYANNNLWKRLVQETVKSLSSEINATNMTSLVHLLRVYGFIDDSSLFASKDEYVHCIENIIIHLPTISTEILLPKLGSILILLDEPHLLEKLPRITRLMLDNLVQLPMKEVAKSFLLTTTLGELKNLLFKYQKNKLKGLSNAQDTLLFDFNISPNIDSSNNDTYAFIFKEALSNSESSLDIYLPIFEEFGVAGAIICSSDPTVPKNFQRACRFLEESIEQATSDRTLGNLFAALVVVLEYSSPRFSNPDSEDFKKTLELIAKFRDHSTYWQIVKNNPVQLSFLIKALICHKSISFYFEGFTLFFKFLNFDKAHTGENNTYNISLAKLHYEKLMVIWPLLNFHRKMKLRTVLAQMLFRNIVYIFQSQEESKLLTELNEFLQRTQKAIRMMTDSHLNKVEQAIVGQVNLKTSKKISKPISNEVDVNEDPIGQFAKFYNIMTHINDNTNIISVQEPNLMRLYGSPNFERRFVRYIVLLIEEMQHQEINAPNCEKRTLAIYSFMIEFLIRRYPQLCDLYAHLMQNLLFDYRGYTEKNYIRHIQNIQVIFKLAINDCPDFRLRHPKICFFFQLIFPESYAFKFSDEESIEFFNQFLDYFVPNATLTIPCNILSKIFTQIKLKLNEQLIEKTLHTLLRVINYNPFALVKDSDDISSPLGKDTYIVNAIINHFIHLTKSRCFSPIVYKQLLQMLTTTHCDNEKHESELVKLKNQLVDFILTRAMKKYLECKSPKAHKDVLIDDYISFINEIFDLHLQIYLLSTNLNEKIKIQRNLEQLLKKIKVDDCLDAESYIQLSKKIPLNHEKTTPTKTDSIPTKSKK